MPYMLTDLVIDRVDLVDEGANSAAFIELYKRKEQVGNMTVEEILSKMKPEHAAVIQDALNESNAAASTANEELEKAKADLAKANEELATAKAKDEDVSCSCDGEPDENGTCKACGKPKKTCKVSGMDETETLKSMPQNIRDMFDVLKAKAEAAEEELRKAKDAEATAEAVAKAKELKAIPIEQDKLVAIIKSATPEVLEVLTVANAAIENTVLDEVGKSHNSASTDADAWSKIEAKADEVAKRDSVSKAKAISVVIKENPDLYREYLSGGAK